jgi:hypothetical protein
MITTELYWMMLSICLGLLASCLPTLRGLFKAKSMESFVHGLRSVFSMTSASRSRSWKGSKSDSPDASFESERVTAGKLNYSGYSEGSVRA